MTVDGREKIADMNDRQIEIIGEFTVGNADFGFSFYSASGDGANLYYSPATGNLVLDMRKLARWSNDDGSFGGLYTTSLPSSVAKGSVMKMHVFVDHSVKDIFINDMWASSVRLFPTESASEGVEVFSEGDSTQARIKAWSLDPKAAAVNDVTADADRKSEFVNVYNTLGVMVKSNAPRSQAFTSLPAGIYIVDGKKIMVR